MVKCPRCDFSVDETTRTTCPLCFTPINVEGAVASAPAPEATAIVPEVSAVPEPPQVAASEVVEPPAVPFTPPPSSIPMPPQQAQPQVPMPPPIIPQMPTLPPQQQQMPGMQQMQGGAMPQPQAVPQAPQYTPGSTPRPGVRVSLTGEVIEEAAPVAPPPNYVGGPVPPPRTGPRPAPAKGKGSGVRSEMTDEQLGTAGNPVAVVILTLMFVVFVGYGGWYYFSSRTNPKDQTTKFLTAIKQQDWKTLYTVVELSDEDKKTIPDAEAFEKDAKAKINSSPMGAQLFNILKDMTFTVAEPKIDGNKASVPYTLNLKFMGQEQTLSQTMELVDHGGWKVKAGGSGMGQMGGQMGGVIR